MTETETATNRSQFPARTLKLIKYDTPESVVENFWAFPGVDPADLEGSTFGGFDEAGNEEEFELTDMVDGIRKMGFWGYADAENNVHVWVDPKARPEDVLFFLGHEIGHLSGTPLAQTGDHSDIAEENRADEYGNAARLAYQWLRELITNPTA